MTNILDPKFRYYPSYDTDLRRTFARVRGETVMLTTAPAFFCGTAPVTVDRRELEQVARRIVMERVK